MKLLLCALTFLLWASAAEAIPVAGTYVLTPGEHDISGTFTSTGTQLSDWSFRAHLQNIDMAWSRQTDLDDLGNHNTAQQFITSNFIQPCELATCQSFDIFYGSFRWNTDPLATQAVFRIDAQCCDWDYPNGPPVVSFARVLAVPEPNTLWLVGVGFVGLLLFVRRVQSRRDLA